MPTIRELFGLLLCTAVILAATLNPAQTLAEEKPMVTLETSKGNIVLEIDAEKAPITAENFLTYVRDGHYDGLVFHRVIPTFMIQGGGMDANMSERETRDPIKNEANNGLSNDAYTIAMARTPDPHSASAQFFINVKDNPFLNFTTDAHDQGWGYAVFGHVVDGQEVVDAIKVVPTHTVGFHENVPVEPVTIIKAFVNE